MRSARLLWCAVAAGATLLACAADLPLPQPGQLPSTGVSSLSLPTREESAEALLARIRPQTGAQPVECGRHFLRQGSEAALLNELATSLDCAKAAALKKQPFWTFVQQQGIDSWLAEGVFGGPDGIIQYFSYDSSPGGNPKDHSNARLTSSACPRPSVGSRNGRATFSCVDVR